MRNILLESLQQKPVEEQLVELVERKGVGHPDSICDAMMEEISVELGRAYMDTFGHYLHWNVDKALLVGGITSPKIGGGTVDMPMRIVFGDRAIEEYKGKKIPVGEIAEATAAAWIRGNLRFVNPEQHVIFQNEIKPGSPELAGIFLRETIGANDTSAGVGYAPLSETEQLVLATERFINGNAFKASYPEAGEDIKVMGYRKGRELTLTVAMAYVDRFVTSQAQYFERKAAMREAVQAYVTRDLRTIDEVIVDINTLDDEHLGEHGMYLSVLGTSAEGGDCGQVGRGNKVNGVIPFGRPMSTEAAAGKNPISHVGKIYNLLSHKMAEAVYEEVEGINEVYIWMCSQIGAPIDDPMIASAHLNLKPGVELSDVDDAVTAIVDRELADIYHFVDCMARGECTVW